MSAYHRNVLVGVIVLVSMGMLAWMVLQFANKAASFFLTSGMRITLTAPRAEGLADGSPVTYKGVNVGRVTGVRRNLNPTDGEDIIIDALIETQPPLPANLVGKIKQTSLLGASATIELEPKPRAASGPATQPANNQDHLVAAANLSAEYVPDITALGDNIRALTNSIQDIISDPQVKGDLKVSLANIRETTASAARLSKHLEDLSNSLDKVATESSGAVGEVRVTVKDARVEMEKFTKSLGDRMDQLALSLKHVQSVAQKIDEGKGTAGQLVNDPKLYQNLADTSAELNLMVKDMRRLIQQWEQEGIVKF